MRFGTKSRNATRNTSCNRVVGAVPTGFEADWLVWMGCVTGRFEAEDAVTSAPFDVRTKSCDATRNTIRNIHAAWDACVATRCLARVSEGASRASRARRRGCLLACVTCVT